jgi:hypothetical protein
MDAVHSGLTLSPTLITIKLNIRRKRSRGGIMRTCLRRSVIRVDVMRRRWSERRRTRIFRMPRILSDIPCVMQVSLERTVNRSQIIVEH